MRIAAGVLIIIVSFFDLFAGFGYALGGALISGGSDLQAKIANEAARQAKDAKTAQEVKELTQKLGEAGTAYGGAAMLFGVFLLAMCGLCIAAGVVLFREKAATFALIVGVLQLGAEGVGFVIIPGISPLGIAIKAFVILSAVLVIVGALSYRGKSTAVPTM